MKSTRQLPLFHSGSPSAKWLKGFRTYKHGMSKSLHFFWVSATVMVYVTSCSGCSNGFPFSLLYLLMPPYILFQFNPKPQSKGLHSQSLQYTKTSQHQRYDCNHEFTIYFLFSHNVSIFTWL